MNHRASPRSGLRIAFVGTRGAPARYGGFETAVEEIGRRLAAEGHDITVYCRTGNSGKDVDPQEFAGMRLVHLPALRHRVLETLSHTWLSALDAVTRRSYDAVLVFNSANAPALPLLRLRRYPVAVHVDGLEWRRSKWGPTGRRYYRAAEALSVRWADALIADAQGIQQYYDEEFGATSDCIAYGAPVVDTDGPDRLGELGLHRDGYHLVVARFEPENHVDLMLEGYLQSSAELPLVVVGSTPYPTEHTARINHLAQSSPKVLMLGGVWDQELLDQLYAGARTYLHGHSVGGTNPSLLRAMGAGAPTIAYDVVFNREVAGPDAVFCASAGEVARAIDAAEAGPAETRAKGAALRQRVRDRYSWDGVARQYGELCRRLAAGESQRRRFSGKRRNSPRWAVEPGRPAAGAEGGATPEVESLAPAS